MKRLYRGFLGFCLIVSMLFTLTFAATNILYAGTCGKNLGWSISYNGTLVIEIMNKPWGDDSYWTPSMGGMSVEMTAHPWDAYRSDFKEVIIGSGVGTIVEHAFEDCDSFNRIVIPKSIERIEQSAFSSCEALTDIYYEGSKTERDRICVALDNEALETATWHYNYSSANVNVFTVNGAQIRTTEEQGLRFISTIDKTSASMWRVVRFGTVLIPSEDITHISELVLGATFNGHEVLDVPAKYYYDESEEKITFTAVITNIKEINYGRSYSARAYAVLDDGRVVYAEDGASRSIYVVAKQGMNSPDESDKNKAVFKKIVDSVEEFEAGWTPLY